MKTNIATAAITIPCLAAEICSDPLSVTGSGTAVFSAGCIAVGTGVGL